MVAAPALEAKATPSSRRERAGCGRCLAGLEHAMPWSEPSAHAVCGCVRARVRAYAYVCRHLGKYECVYPREPVRVRKIFAASRCV